MHLGTQETYQDHGPSNKKPRKNREDTIGPQNYRQTTFSEEQDNLSTRHDLSTDEDKLSMNKGRNGILPHGPNYQGPRTLLTIHQES